MKIGEIAKQSGFTRDTLRYYEKIGLIQLDRKQRGENNYRIYDDSILRKLQMIKGLKKIGFTLQEIKDLQRMEELNLVSCKMVEMIVQPKLKKLDQQIKELQAQKDQLLYLSESCTGNCLGSLNNS